MSKTDDMRALVKDARRILKAVRKQIPGEFHPKYHAEELYKMLIGALVAAELDAEEEEADK